MKRRNMRNMLAIKIERRRIAVSVFSGLHLEDLQVRHLPQNLAEGIERAAAFIHWIASAYAPDIAALIIPPEGDMRRSQVTKGVVSVLREEGIPVWEVEKDDLLESF